MDSLRNVEVGVLISETLLCIEEFIRERSQHPAAVTAEQLQLLSAHIERAKSFRELTSAGNSSTQDSIWLRYGRSLQALRSLLSDIEDALQEHRDRCLETQNRLFHVREWHSTFTKTQ